MSFSTDDRKLRGRNGNRFPFDPAAETGALLAEVVAEALKADFGAIPSHVKHLARLTGTNERTVHNWLLARNGPSGTALVVLMRHSDAVNPTLDFARVAIVFSFHSTFSGVSVTAVLFLSYPRSPRWRT